MFTTQELIDAVEKFRRLKTKSNIQNYKVNDIITYIEQNLYPRYNSYEIEYSENDDSETEEYYRNISYRHEAEEIFEGFDFWDYDRIYALFLIFQFRPDLKKCSEKFVDVIAKMFSESNIEELKSYNKRQNNDTEYETIYECLDDFELNARLYNQVKSNINNVSTNGGDYPLLVTILLYKDN